MGCFFLYFVPFTLFHNFFWQTLLFNPQHRSTMLRVSLLSTLLIASKSVCALNLREGSVPEQQESFVMEEQVLERNLESGMFQIDISLNIDDTNTPCSSGEIHDLKSLLWQQIDYWVPIALSVDDEQAVVEYVTLSHDAGGTRDLVGEDEEKLSTEELHPRSLQWSSWWAHGGGYCHYCYPDDDDGWRRLDADIKARLQALIEPGIQTYVERMACYQGTFSIDIANFIIG